MKPKSLLFDLDNTLIDRDAALKQLIIELFGPLKETDLQSIMKKDNHGYTKRKDFATWLIQEYSSYNKKHYTAQQFFDFQIENVGNYVEPVEQATIDLLDFCQEHFEVFLLSNGGTINQTKKLEKSKLAAYFPIEKRVISGTIGFHKPDKRIFEHLIQKFDLDRTSTLMIGDDIINDIQGAQQLGLATCWIANGRTFPKEKSPPTYTVENLLVPNFQKYLMEWKEA